MLEVVKCQRRNQRMLEKGREPRMQRSQLNLKNVLPCLLSSFEEWGKERNTSFECRLQHCTLAQLANYEKCLKFNVIGRIVIWLAALIEALFNNLLRPHYHPVVACVFDRCRHWSEMARPMSYHDGVVGSSYHTLAHLYNAFPWALWGTKVTAAPIGIMEFPTTLKYSQFGRFWECCVLNMMRKVLELAKKSAKGEFFAFAMMISGWTNIQ